MPVAWRKQLWPTLAMTLVLALLMVFLAYPILLTVQGGFAKSVTTQAGAPAPGFWDRWTLDHIKMVFIDPRLREGLINSFKVATLTTTLACVIALPLALLSARTRFPLKSLWNALILVPLILPPFVGAIGVRALLGRRGAINALFGTEFDFFGEASLLGVILVQALSLYPIIYLNTTAALANLDPALDESAENLGAGWWTRLRRVTLPLVLPGIFAGATIVFIWSLTELGTPLMFEYKQVTPVQIFDGIKEVETSAQPYALVVVLLAAAILSYVVGKWLLGGKAYAMYAKASRASVEKALSPVHGWLVSGLFGLVIFIAIMPHVGVVLTSLTVPGSWYRTVLPRSLTGDHYSQALAAPDSFVSIVNSLKYASLATVINLALGLLVGYLLVRTKAPGRGLLDALCMLPLAVPGLVMAFGFIAMSTRWPMGKDGPLGNMILGATPNPLPLLVAAYAVRRLPYIVRSTVAGLQQTSGELEEAAINLGASRFTAVRRVIVPLILANLIAGALLVFSFSMLEVSDSLLLAQRAEDAPITKAIWDFSNRLADGPYIASAMGVWGMALLTVTLVGASLLLGKKMGAIFRA